MVFDTVQYFKNNFDPNAEKTTDILLNLTNFKTNHIGLLYFTF